ncbi:SDR family oxidoreductase [Roseinatronobacter alkalisoli]|uniref:SDR family oxidoreductase n=1 Tax=Roseinatronobacter alkalisoli TaxID=3028235 RepID=A0ABT5T7W1_9RHOB|nr:SDR family oxidoreductase [Roseinatronobacter sp. HJB301]MDD7971219.1 SDR family oxidoreductase [Roseinatronobacter sp. HJB301]
MTGTLLSIGHGYSAQALEPLLLPRGWTIIGTTRNADKAHAMAARGVTPLIWPGTPLPLAQATHVLTSVAPRQDDPVLAAHGDQIASATHLRWVGYLSTIGIYGDHQGAWVDEDTVPNAVSARARARVNAETAWQDICARAGVRLHIFRLAGIYGPGRGPIAKLREGRAQRVVKPGQYFSRIHQADIGQALDRAIHSDIGNRVYNLCDDHPAPPQDVLACAARLAGMPVPPEIPFEDADLTPMARSFYADSKRVRNDRIKRDLGVELLYPDYESGLRAILDAEG